MARVFRGGSWNNNNNNARRSNRNNNNPNNRNNNNGFRVVRLTSPEPLLGNTSRLRLRCREIFLGDGAT
jgi:hypothetical protein